METKLRNNQSKARRIKILLKKYDGRFKSYLEMSQFEEPILFLLRRNRRVEFHEKATAGKFIFKHSDGEERDIDLEPQYLHTFDYGKRTFKGYVCHEDYKHPLPENPVVTGEMFQMSIDKTLNDFKKWKAQEARAIGDMWWKILLGIGVVIGILALAKLLVPSLHIPFFGGGGEQVTRVIVQNASDIARDVTQLP